MTQREYEAVMKANPAYFQRKTGGGPEHPVEQVSWDDAVALLPEAVGPGGGEEKRAGVYRLPTEAEWEYACRAGDRHAVHLRRDAAPSNEANFDGNGPTAAADGTVPAAGPRAVGSFPANALGLHDMHGNVWEWCSDWYTPKQQRALRGGSWNNSGHLCRAARRQNMRRTSRPTTWVSAWCWRSEGQGWCCPQLFSRYPLPTFSAINLSLALRAVASSGNVFATRSGPRCRFARTA